MPREPEWVELPNGTRIAQSTGRGSRYYMVEGDPAVEGKKLVSATTALKIIDKPALIGWSNKMGRLAMADVLKGYLDEGQVITKGMIDEGADAARSAPNSTKFKAADFGTAAHTLIEEIIAGQDPDIPEEFREVVDNFLAWEREAGIVELDLSEQRIYSAQYLYAGTKDARGWKLRNGKKVLIAMDWKTSNGIWDEMALQVAAYAHAWEEMTGEKAEEGWIIRLGKEQPEFEVKKIALEPAFEAFVAALTLYNAMAKDMWEV